MQTLRCSSWIICSRPWDANSSLPIVITVRNPGQQMEKSARGIERRSEDSLGLLISRRVVLKRKHLSLLLLSLSIAFTKISRHAHTQTMTHTSTPRPSFDHSPTWSDLKLVHDERDVREIDDLGSVWEREGPKRWGGTEDMDEAGLRWRRGHLLHMWARYGREIGGRWRRVQVERVIRRRELNVRKDTISNARDRRL